MIDIHCHILPLLDDGPTDIDESVSMSRMAADDGITHIVATPHFSYNERPAVKDIKEGLEILQVKLDEHGIPVRLLPGADIRLTYELLKGIETSDIPTINNSRYFLLELPDVIPPHLDNFIFTALLKGFVPVITHPERNHGLLSSPAKIETLRESGALFQVTAMSITGEFGNRIRNFSFNLIKNGFVDFIASDAHSSTWRIPTLSKAYREISGSFKERLAVKIFIENPAALIENRDINR
jgi:protein-tyrosine phosphatase